ncbi:hypothetical protein AB0I81_25385 [Nonomuraea sp. NPDC050404]|uniref:hypothetical protein n=1 Tax=Nonomuraea sp. NPDC050404 TaxID=3155783 RepID=UPI0033DE4096
MNSARSHSNRTRKIIILGAIPLLLVNWFIVSAIMGNICVVLYEGGNITECGGGLSEEEMSALSGLIALVLFVVQVGLIAIVGGRVSLRRLRR